MTGDQRSYGVMANVYYDFDLAAFSPGLNNWIQPYVGFGAGYASVSYRGFRVLLGNSSLQASMNGTGNVLAYQGIVGAAFPIGFLPGLSLTAEARYYATTQPAFSGSVQTVPQQNQNQNGQQQQPFTLSQFRGHVDVRATSLLLGVRYNFDAPAPAAAGGNLPVGWSVPALPAAARTYVVYFANDSAALDAVARQTIAESVQGARAAQASSLELVGRADATGNPQRNQRLATQRSENVAMELVRLGVPRGAIRTLAVGQNGEPPGVNAQARRVDIVLR
jgi:outer membrane protein OmpA-like peptidoglycan-associated protein